MKTTFHHSIRIISIQLKLNKTKSYAKWKEGYAALTIIVENESERSRATIIGSGGGEGFFNISYGTNSDFVNSAAEALYSCYEFGYKKE